MKNTNRATEFSNDLKRVLEKNRNFGEKLGVSKWVKNWRVPGTHETVDVAGLRSTSSPVVLIEAELLREDPASNVVKIWKWAQGQGSRQKFVLFQAFSKVYRGRKLERKARAMFVGERMVKEVRNAIYAPVNFDYNPRPGGKVGAGRRCHHAQLLAGRIVRRGQKLRIGS